MGKNVILVAVSGWGQDEDKRLAEDAGFDSHLTKPVGTEAVEQLLVRLKPIDR